MNASTGTLPRQVQEKNDRIDAAIAAAKAEAEGEETPPPAPEAPPAAPVAPEPVSTAPQDFEHKYSVLQGKYDSEIAQLRAENAALKDNAAPVSPAMQDSPAPVPPPPQAYVTDEDVETFGQDTIDVTQRIAEGVAAETMAPYIEQQRHSQEQTFYAELNRQAPNWESLNNDPGFHSWLDYSEPYSNGWKRLHFLVDARNQFNAQSAASFFNGYLTFLQAKSPAAPPAPETIPIPGVPGTHVPEQTIPQQDVNTQIVPPQVQATAQTMDGMPMYTATQVRSHFTEYSKHVGHGRVPQRLREEHKEINQAIRDDRVIAG